MLQRLVDAAAVEAEIERVRLLSGATLRSRRKRGHRRIRICITAAYSSKALGE
jgi:hypothetical protein